MIGKNLRCDYILFDTCRNNRVAAFIFEERPDIPGDLEAVGGWSCPVLEMSADDICLLNQRGGKARFQSRRARKCPTCIRKSLHESRWRAARVAFHRWKKNCRFVYN